MRLGVPLVIVGCQQESDCPLPEILKKKAAEGLAGREFSCTQCHMRGVVDRVRRGYWMRVNPRESVLARLLGAFLFRQ